jgi:hypothetical protein
MAKLLPIHSRHQRKIIFENLIFSSKKRSGINSFGCFQSLNDDEFHKLKTTNSSLWVKQFRYKYLPQYLRGL